MTSPSIVRLARPEDEASLMEMCRLLHQENGVFSMDDDLVLAVLRRAFERQGVIIGVIGPEHALEGVICLVIGSFWYSRQPHLEELFNFVHPEHRRSDHAKALIEFAKQCSSESAPLVIGVISNERTEAKVRLYERRLGKPAGAFFLYPNHNSPAQPVTEH